MNIVTFAEARARGLPRYFTGIPCKHGHIAERRTNNSVCVGCEQARRNFQPRGVTVHGLSGTVEHNIWSGIRKRCNNPKCKIYKYYGGRGIKMCERWDDFSAFLQDMGPRPSADHSVERRDRNGNYEPGNCYWATKKEQMRNKGDNRLVTLNGETHCVAEWAEKLGLSATAIYLRLDRGESPEQALGPMRRPVRQPKAAQTTTITTLPER